MQQSQIIFIRVLDKMKRAQEAVQVGVRGERAAGALESHQAFLWSQVKPFLCTESNQNST